MDPYLSSNFLVEIDGIIRASFRQVGGIESSIDVVTLREGGSLTPKKFPGLVQYANITLSHGVTDDTQLYDWYMQWATGEPTAPRKAGHILLLDRQGNERTRYSWIEGFPVKWSGPAPNAEASEIAIDMFELAHHGITRVG